MTSHDKWHAAAYYPEGTGRTVLTTLEAGDELPISRGTTLDHLDGMLLPTTEPP